MTSVLYLGCPASERADAENLLSAGQVSVVWADDLACALDALHRRDMPVLLDLSRGAAALQLAHDLRIHRASTLMFAFTAKAFGARRIWLSLLIGFVLALVTYYGFARLLDLRIGGGFIEDLF